MQENKDCRLYEAHCEMDFLKMSLRSVRIRNAMLEVLNLPTPTYLKRLWSQ